jgi:hypothetical protein
LIPTEDYRRLGLYYLKEAQRNLLFAKEMRDNSGDDDILYIEGGPYFSNIANDLDELIEGLK